MAFQVYAPAVTGAGQAVFLSGFWAPLSKAFDGVKLGGFGARCKRINKRYDKPVFISVFAKAIGINTCFALRTHFIMIRPVGFLVLLQKIIPLT